MPFQEYRAKHRSVTKGAPGKRIRGDERTDDETQNKGDDGDNVSRT